MQKAQRDAPKIQLLAAAGGRESPSWEFLSLVLFGNRNSAERRAGAKRKGGKLVKAAVSSLPQGFSGVQQRQSPLRRARLPCRLHRAEYLQEKNWECAEFYSLML